MSAGWADRIKNISVQRGYLNPNRPASVVLHDRSDYLIDSRTGRKLVSCSQSKTQETKCGPFGPHRALTFAKCPLNRRSLVDFALQCVAVDTVATITSIQKCP